MLNLSLIFVSVAIRLRYAFSWSSKFSKSSYSGIPPPTISLIMRPKLRLTFSLGSDLIDEPAGRLIATTSLSNLCLLITYRPIGTKRLVGIIPLVQSVSPCDNWSRLTTLFIPLPVILINGIPCPSVSSSSSSPPPAAPGTTGTLKKSFSLQN